MPGGISSEERKSRTAKRTFVLYILVAMLVLLLLLLIQADGRIDGILRIFAGYAMEKAPLLISCLVLALFPAAIIYSFLSNLKDVFKLYSNASQPVDTPDTSSPLVTLLWPNLSILLTVVNWLFLLVEIYYSAFQRTALPPQDNLYDVLAIILLIFIGLAAICCQIWFLKGGRRKMCIALGVSVFGLIIVAGCRLLAHIVSFGLWSGQAVLSVILLSYVLILCCMLGFSSLAPDAFFRKMGVIIAVFLVLVNMIPSGVVLTEVNASIFLRKYHALQLDGQRGADTGEPAELTDHDLRLDLMESYGIHGIPALTSLVGIEDVTVNGQTLGLHIRGTILDCLCDDLGLSRTRDDQYDIKAVFEASNNIPRYRLPTSYAWALNRLKGVESTFHTSTGAED